MVRSSQLQGEGTSMPLLLPCERPHPVIPPASRTESPPLSPLKVPGSMSCGRTWRLGPRSWGTPVPGAISGLHTPGSLLGMASTASGGEIVGTPN